MYTESGRRNLYVLAPALHKTYIVRTRICFFLFFIDFVLVHVFPYTALVLFFQMNIRVVE